MANMKRIVWSSWAINAVISCLYMALAIVSFYNVKSGTKYMTGDNNYAYKNGLLASCMVPFLVLLFFLIFSFIILISKLFKSEAQFGYGFMLGLTLQTSWLLLLSGLNLNASERLAKSFEDSNIWSSTDYSTYVATYAFAYILTGTYLILFAVLFAGRSQMGSRAAAPAASTSGVPASVPPAAGSAPSGKVPNPANPFYNQRSFQMAQNV